MKKIKITKMHGCGNDFVVIEKPELEKTGLTMSEFAKKVCDRHFGIGADGVLIPDIEDKGGCDIAWHYLNSDGTTAQMCGNGMRCFAKYVTDRGIMNKSLFSVKTGAGTIKPEILSNGQIKVNMSSPILEPEKIPVLVGSNLNQKLTAGDREFVFNAVSMGNPHCVIITEEDVYELAKTYGPKIESHNLFPEKTNVEFIKVKSRDEIDFCVYERGCGITLACGTGACASVVATVLNGLTDSIVKVNLLGGQLIIDWSEHEKGINDDIYLIGPAQFVFDAEYII